jgi:hypothetical protein
MPKFAENSVLDAALNAIKAGTRVTVTSGVHANSGSATPPTAAQIDAIKLAQSTGLTGASYTGPADGTTSGRKLSVNAIAGVSISASGTATHIYIDNGTTGLYVTTCTSQALTSGNTVNIPLWTIEIADPT